jgi:adenylosuccinate lyase
MEDLENAWEVLAEPIQTVMRRHGIPDSYEQLKELTRGKEGINRETLHSFIGGLNLPESEKTRLCKMTPQNYIGDAAVLARKIGVEDS